MTKGKVEEGSKIKMIYKDSQGNISLRFSTPRTFNDEFSTTNDIMEDPIKITERRTIRQIEEEFERT